ncbi:hypothetical protein JCM11641_008205 [Rhodosporidiobolus odoratus]
MPTRPQMSEVASASVHSSVQRHSTMVQVSVLSVHPAREPIPSSTAIPLVSSVASLHARLIWARKWLWEVKADLYEKYNSTVLVVPSVFPPQVTVMVGDGTLIHDVGADRKTFSTTETTDAPILSHYGTNLLTLANGEDWRRHRRVAVSSFSDKNLAKVWDEAVKATGKWHEMLKSEAEKDGKTTVKKVGEVLAILTLIIMGASAFGVFFSWPSSVTSPSSSTGPDMSLSQAASVVFNEWSPMKFLPTWVIKYLPLAKFRRISSGFETFEKELRRTIAERKAELVDGDGGERQDLLGRLVKANLSEEGRNELSDEELLADAYIFVGAGQVTSSAALTTLFLLLALYLSHQGDVYQEVKAALASPEPFSYSKMFSNLPQTRAVIQEGLRVAGPINEAPRTARKDTSPGAKTMDGGERTAFVPEGAKVKGHIGGAQYSTLAWDDPYDFRPSRFLENDSDRSSYIPFGSGLRGCIGKQFALAQMLVVVSLTLVKYRIEVIDAKKKQWTRRPGETERERRDRLIDGSWPITMSPQNISLTFALREERKVKATVEGARKITGRRAGTGGCSVHNRVAGRMAATYGAQPMDQPWLHLDPAYAAQAQAALAGFSDPSSSSTWPLQPPEQHQLETGLSSGDLVWLEQQLSLAAAGSPAFTAPPTPAQPTTTSLPPAPQGPHAFPPVSNARFHPYQLPTERPQRNKQQGATANPAHLFPHHLYQPPFHPPSSLQRPPLGPAASSTGPFDWPSFGTVASSFFPVPPPPPPRHFANPLPAHAQVSPRTSVLYPPHDLPSPLLLPDVPTPTYPPAPRASPASYISSVPSPPPFSPQRPPRARRRRARSAPPPVSLSLIPSIQQRPPLFAGSGPSKQADEAVQERDDKRQRQLEMLFSWLDKQRWSFSHLFTALSDLDPGSEVEHRRRMEEFLQLEAGGGAGEEESARLLRETKRRWAMLGGEAEGEKGPDEIVRMWEDLGGLGRKREGNMANAVRELQSNVHDGAVAGVSIRRIINRYGEAYNESASDIQRLDAALSAPLSPHVTSVPREANVWTGTLVVPTMQANVLQGWLTAPGRPKVDKVEPQHMRIYSSLSPLDLHARGAELCRNLLLRDADLMKLHGHNFDRLHSFAVGPVLAPLDTCGFAHYDDFSLFHHAVMVYLQLFSRYPQLRDGKDATINILPDLPPPVHPTPLESRLIDSALRDHWEFLRLFLLEEHGGLLRSAVRAFAGVKLSKVDLLSVCDDTKAVIRALGRNKKNPNDRILAYDPSIPEVRNAWRQQAYHDPTVDLVVWSAATTHFLELSAIGPDWSLGVRDLDLPGLGSILSQAASGGTNGAGAGNQE